MQKRESQMALLPSLLLFMFYLESQKSQSWKGSMRSPSSTVPNASSPNRPSTWALVEHFRCKAVCSVVGKLIVPHTCLKSTQQTFWKRLVFPRISKCHIWYPALTPHVSSRWQTSLISHGTLSADAGCGFRMLQKVTTDQFTLAREINSSSNSLLGARLQSKTTFL